MDLPLPVGAVFRITIPTEVSIHADDGTLLLTGAAGGGSLFASASVQILDAATQQVEVSNLVPSYVNQVDPNNPITFGLLQLKNPGSIQTTPEFAIAIYQEEDIILNVDQDGLTYTASPGVLANLIVQPEDYKTRKLVQYFFSFETANALYVFGDMAIIVPPEIDVDESALVFTPTVGISLTSIITVSWDEATRTIRINNAFD